MAEKIITPIQKVMKAKGVKASQLVKTTGIIKGNLSLIVNGKQHNMQLITLKKLCTALKCKSIDILGW